MTGDPKFRKFRNYVHSELPVLILKVLSIDNARHTSSFGSVVNKEMRAGNKHEHLFYCYLYLLAFVV